MFERPRPRRSGGVAAAALCGAVVLAVLLFGRLDRDRALAAAPEPSTALAVPSVRVVAQPGYVVVEQYSGAAVSRRSSRLGFTLAGRVEAVLVEEGDVVEPGQVLARLDDRKLRAHHRELRAQIEETKARLALASQTLQRSDKLVGEQSVSRQVHDEARFERQALAARLVAAQSSLESVEVDLEDSQLVAPYAASIVGRALDEGAIVAPGQEVLQLRERGAMEARIGVSERSSRLLQIGDRYAIAIPGGVTVDAQLAAVLDEVRPETRTVTAIFRFGPGAPELRSGSLVRLQLETHREGRGFWLPISALAESRRGLWSAYALVPTEGEPGAFVVERRELQILHAESDRAFLRGTIDEGELVVSAGLQRIVPRQIVRLAADAPAAGR